MLDLRRDRYFHLDPETATAIASLRSACQRGVAADETLLPRLAERGFLIEGDDAAGDARPLPSLPGTSLIGNLPQVGLSLGLVPAIAAALWRCRRGLKRGGVEAAVAEARLRKPAAGTQSGLALHLARFRTARRLVPIAPNCLTDSLVLSAFLAARGIRSDLIFGVKLDPFAAHCWLQTEEAILNDSADIVSDFTPILAA
jgi:hypothetical protein